MSAAEALEAFATSLRDCRKCGLSEGRTQVVFGTGDAEAGLMFVGEGPGFHEDRQGEPFVGQAGRLLNDLLAGIGLTRDDVYIANVVKCRPPDNRDPAAEEIEACSPHLFQQIETIRPRVICTLGRFATKLLADTDQSMTAIHGKAKETELGGVRVLLFPVFHPAAALYTPSNRTMLEEDFAKLRVLLDKGGAAIGAGSEAHESGDGMPAKESTPDVAEDRRQPAGDSSSPSEQLPLW